MGYTVDSMAELDQFWYPLETEQALIKAVLAGDEEGLRETLDAVYRKNPFIEEPDEPIGALVRMELVATLLKIHCEKDGLVPEERKQSVTEGLVADLRPPGTGPGFERIRDSFLRLANERRKRGGTGRAELVENVVRYIKERFIFADLSLSGTAEAFGITASYLSSIFKEEKGENFSVFLDRLRSEHAAELLLRTELPVKEVAEKSGYFSGLTLRRNFHKTFGANPAEFRRGKRVSDMFADRWFAAKAHVEKEFIFAHTDPPGSHREQSAEFFARKLRAHTRGEYSVKTYPGTFTGYDSHLLELVAGGGVDFALAGPSIYGQYKKEMGALMTPFLINTREEGRHVYEDSFVVRMWYRDLETKGFKMLAPWEAGFRCINSVIPVSVPGDLSGSVIRVPPNPVHAALWRYLGVEPLELEIKEVYQAFIDKRIQVEENPISVIHAQGFYKVAPCISLTRHIYTPLLLSVSMKTWMKIPVRIQEAVKRAAEETEVYSRELCKRLEAKTLHEMVKAGAHIIHPDRKLWTRTLAEAAERVKEEFGLSVVL
jgi:tripartite ATP-independent transporter DctP family solute receptor